MPITIDQLLGLTAPEKPLEVRSATLLVLGELGIRDAAASQVILEALATSEPSLRLRAIKSAGQLKVEKALPLLIERIGHGGEEGEAAATAAARLGSKGTHALQELMHKVVPGVQKYIASALASSPDGSGEALGVGMLKEKNPAAVEAAVQTLASRIATLDKKKQKGLIEELFALAKDKKANLTPAGEAGLVRIAALLKDERVETLLWDRTLPPYESEVRAAALQALGKFDLSPSKDQRSRLFRCATDSQFRVAAPAMMLLDKVGVTDKTLSEWLSLFDAADLAPRRFALGKIAGRDTPEIAEVLVEQIHNADRKYREEVLSRLANLTNGRKALAKPLRESDSADEAWALARAISPFAQGDPETWQSELFTPACKLLEASDRRADALLFVLKEAGGVELRDRLEAKAAAALKKEDFEKALLYYKTASRDPACGYSIRLGLATVGLKLSKKELEAESRAHDHSLHQFADLIRQDEPGTFKALEKTKWLGADELYYLGFHFVDHSGVMGDFGAEVLKHLVKRFPKSKLAPSAKNKLKSSGQK